MSDSAPDYKSLLSGIIKNQIVILGPAITLAKARHVRGLAVADDGTVTSISEKPEIIIRELHDQFSELSAFIAKKTLTPALVQTQPAAPTQPTQPAEDNNDSEGITGTTSTTGTTGS
jgi:hypothetical protein